MPAALPRSIGRWRVRRVLGIGGMGTVYLGQRGHRFAAVKVINPGLAHDPEFRARFEREISIARRVQGPHTADVLDADVTSTRPWYASTFVEGPTLLEHVRAAGPLADSQVSALALALAGALRDIHRSGVIHRDLKPANVLLSAHGPVVVDFGIASAVDLTSMTRSGHVLGSANWMAPEQLEGARVTTAIDIFAWAATVAFAATGSNPFGAKPRAHRAAGEKPNLDGVPDALIPLLRRSLHDDPHQRPDATDLCSALSTTLLDSTMGTSPTTIDPLDQATIAAAVAKTWAPSAFIPAPKRRRSPLAVATAVAGGVIALTAIAVLVLNLLTSPGNTHPPGAAGPTGTTSTSPTPLDDSARSQLSSAPPPAIDAIQVGFVLNSVPINRGQETWDNEATYYVASSIGQQRLINDSICGTPLRPAPDVPHRSSSGYGVEGYDNDLREVFGFPDADTAVQFVAAIRQAVKECPHDSSTGRQYDLTTRPLTGYAEVAFTEHDGTEPNFPIAVVWHVLRVGSAVLIQSRGTYDSPRNVKLTRAGVTDTANDIAPYLCPFTVSGC